MSLQHYQTVMRDGPRGYYRLGELSGTIARDSSGNGYDGELHGGVTLNQQGAITGDPNRSMLFNGTSGYIELAPGFDVAGWTTATFGWRQYITSVANLPVPLSNAQTYVNPLGFLIYIDSGGTPAVHFSYGNGSTIFDDHSVTPIELNTWQYIAITVDSASVRFYIDGAPVRTVAHSFAGFVASPYPIAIARSQDANSNYVTGNMDEVMIYNRVLSPDQVMAHYHAGINGDIFQRRGRLAA